jgi:hypothetical protein
MSYPRNPFVVLQGSGFSYKVLGDTPTPALIDACSDGRPHDPPGTEYTQVYVSHRPECPGSMGIGHLVEWGETLYGPRKVCRRDAIEDGLLPRFLPHPGSETNTDPHVWDDLRDEVYEDVETYEQAQGRAAELNAELVQA